MADRISKIQMPSANWGENPKVYNIYDSNAVHEKDDEGNDVIFIFDCGTSTEVI